MTMHASAGDRHSRACRRCVSQRDRPVSKRCCGPVSRPSEIPASRGFTKPPCKVTAIHRLSAEVSRSGLNRGADLRRSELTRACYQRRRELAGIRATARHLAGGQVVAGSNPVSPTKFIQLKCHVYLFTEVHDTGALDSVPTTARNRHPFASRETGPDLRVWSSIRPRARRDAVRRAL
jgi:hypothetical protein